MDQGIIQAVKNILLITFKFNP